MNTKFNLNRSYIVVTTARTGKEDLALNDLIGVIKASSNMIELEIKRNDTLKIWHTELKNNQKLSNINTDKKLEDDDINNSQIYTSDEQKTNLTVDNDDIILSIENSSITSQIDTSKIDNLELNNNSISKVSSNLTSQSDSPQKRQQPNSIPTQKKHLTNIDSNQDSDTLFFAGTENLSEEEDHEYQKKSNLGDNLLLSENFKKSNLSNSHLLLEKCSLEKNNITKELDSNILSEKHNYISYNKPGLKTYTKELSSGFQDKLINILVKQNKFPQDNRHCITPKSINSLNDTIFMTPESNFFPSINFKNNTSVDSKYISQQSSDNFEEPKTNNTLIETKENKSSVSSSPRSQNFWKVELDVSPIRSTQSVKDRAAAWGSNNIDHSKKKDIKVLHGSKVKNVKSKLEVSHLSRNSVRIYCRNSKKSKLFSVFKGKYIIRSIKNKFINSIKNISELINNHIRSIKLKPETQGYMRNSFLQKLTFPILKKKLPTSASSWVTHYSNSTETRNNEIEFPEDIIGFSFNSPTNISISATPYTPYISPITNSSSLVYNIRNERKEIKKESSSLKKIPCIERNQILMETTAFASDILLEVISVLYPVRKWEYVIDIDGEPLVLAIETREFPRHKNEATHLVKSLLTQINLNSHTVVNSLENTESSISLASEIESQSNLIKQQLVLEDCIYGNVIDLTKLNNPVHDLPNTATLTDELKFPANKSSAIQNILLSTDFSVRVRRVRTKLGLVAKVRPLDIACSPRPNVLVQTWVKYGSYLIDYAMSRSNKCSPKFYSINLVGLAKPNRSNLLDQIHCTFKNKFPDIIGPIDNDNDETILVFCTVLRDIAGFSVLTDTLNDDLRFLGN